MNGVVPQLSNVALTDNNDGRKLVKAGDFVINSRSDRKGSGGIASEDGSVSVISIVLRPTGIDPRYAHHLLRSFAFQEEFFRWGSGIVADLWSTRFSAMRRIALPVPPNREQMAIADFLDRETAKIDALIEKERRLIDGLLRRRENLIETVVGGAPNRPTVPLKRALRAIDQGISPDTSQAETDSKWSVLKAGCSNHGIFNEDESKPLPTAIPISPNIVVRSGDLVTSRANGSPQLVGSTALVGNIRRRLILSDKTFRLIPKPRINNRYLYWFMNSPSYRSQVRAAISGAEGLANNLPMSALRRIRIWIPSKDEQQESVSKLDAETTKIDEVVATTRRLVTVAEERRVALISAVVTGQLDIFTGRVA